MIMVAHDSHPPTTATENNTNGLHFSSSKVLGLDDEVGELNLEKSSPEVVPEKADLPSSFLLLGDLRVHECEENLKDASNGNDTERKNGSFRGTRVRRAMNGVSRNDWARLRDSLEVDTEPLVAATHASSSLVSLSSNPSSFGIPSMQLLVQPHNAIKVIKGEIHNVLNVMRADARYASPLRFVEELPLDEHPLLLQLKELHTSLSVWEATHPTKAPQLLGYLAPFCSAVSGRDISGNITGAALSALHKFLLYGFVLPETPSAHEGMALIAKSLLQCTFEESAPGVSAEKRRINGRSVAIMLDDEQVVMKLLELIALVVRCSLLETATLLEADVVVGLLDTCLHVSLRAKMASPLLRSSADDALGQIVLQVFCGVGEPLLPARTNVLTKLSSLLTQSLDVRPCVTSLIMLNIALETMRQEPSPAEISILQNDLCKHLLQLSTTHDLIILNLTLRVIFNLFQSIRNHLKVPLEVFLTSVHLRILDPTSSSTPEEREVALEGLLEFCQEPSLMQDIYLNYDCDVHCTNLYEAICSTLARVASQADRVAEHPSDSHAPHPVVSGFAQSPLNVLSRLAVEGILAVIESIASRCQGEPPAYLRLNSSSSSDVEEQEQDFEGATEVEDVLKERKRKKHGLAKVAVIFNLKPTGPDWLKAATDLQVIPSPPTAPSVAEFLYATPGLDMAQVGLYLSKGPAKDYPFHAGVREEFCKLFDFKGKNFASALRNFLAKFRLPGEAQCIDRLMEAFSKELYKQQCGEESIFRSADSVFVLAFSTIMLNTDLHNPTIKDDRRMTLEQFKLNNRGINEGEDLPVDFLTELYEEIKTCEIQVQQDFTELQVAIRRHSGEDFRAAWDGILSKTELVATPFFTSADAARQTVFHAGVHERDMFIAIAKSALQSISTTFIRSRDDALVVKILKGLEHMARVCIYFELDGTLNEILSFLMKQGRDYVARGIAKENLMNDPVLDAESFTTVNTDDSEQSSNDASSASLKFDASSSTDPTKSVVGSAAHRGLLALDCALQQVRLQSSHLREAWPTLIECLCVLRDARALPTGLADLDDFADSKSNVLPLSTYAKESLRRVEEHYRLHTDQSKPSKKGWFRMPRFKHGADSSNLNHSSVNFQSSAPRRMSGGGKPSSFTLSLLSVSEAAELESIILMCAGPLPRAKQTIRALLDTVNVNILEQHAVFSLELAARALLSTRDQCAELFPLFLSKFEALLSLRAEGDSSGLPSPFLMERVVITVLRSCIHLYDLKAVRSQVCCISCNSHC
jgi:brefeldin A-resistance guanine nucleotide exchange factor 1